MARIRSFAVVSVAIALSGCATTVEDIHHFSTRQIGPSLTMVTSSSQLIVTNPDGTICVGPPPDATADMGYSASVSVLATGGGPGGSDGIAGGEEEVALGGRNPNVLLSRDLLFQSCLAEARLQLSPDERKEHYQALLDLLAKINANSLEGKNVENIDQAGQQNPQLPGSTK